MQRGDRFRDAFFIVLGFHFFQGFQSNSAVAADLLVYFMESCCGCSPARSPAVLISFGICYFCYDSIFLLTCAFDLAVARQAPMIDMCRSDV